MIYLAVDKDGDEILCKEKLYRVGNSCWESKHGYDFPCIILPKGSIEKLIGRKLTWQDEQVELKDN